MPRNMGGIAPQQCQVICTVPKRYLAAPKARRLCCQLLLKQCMRLSWKVGFLEKTLCSLRIMDVATEGRRAVVPQAVSRNHPIK